MVLDVRDRLVIDPLLGVQKVEVVGVRLLQKERLSDGESRHETAIALRRLGKKWPKGRYRIQVYDSSGLMLEKVLLDENTSLDADRRHLEGAFYCEDFETAELLFEPEVGAQSEGWDELAVQLDAKSAEKVSVEARGVRAKAHADYDYNNLIAVELTGDVRPTFGLPFPEGLWAQVTVLDEGGYVLNSEQLDLRYGPDSVRSIRQVVKVYSHEEPAAVRIDFFLV